MEAGLPWKGIDMCGKGRQLTGFLLVIALGIGLGAALLIGSATAGRLKGEWMPAFTLELFDEGKLHSQDLKGQVVVIRFLASW